jgi:uncharacterized protein YfiM (DUF2279 family)
MIAGLLWEIRDSFITGFSWKDLIADAAGLLAGFALIQLL